MSESIPRLTDRDYEQLAEHIQTLLQGVEALPFPQVKDQVFELLHCLDLLHREALTRLVGLIDAQAPHLKAAIANDYALQALMMLYGFVPVDEAPTPPPPVTNRTFIPLTQLLNTPAIREPLWAPAGNLATLPAGAVHGLVIEGERILLANVAGVPVAYQNACLDSILPLDRGTVTGHMLLCPWHGCRYDLRSGEIQNGSGLKLTQYPVLVGERGDLRIGFNIPPHLLPPPVEWASVQADE
ncbi:MAG: Rieske (2Fe-2S) protein [Caldilinea sp. CFX5]|nr:Rieske (2Fe-2S) protein [Caldilinea sp. CFX5]